MPAFTALPEARATAAVPRSRPRAALLAPALARLYVHTALTVLVALTVLTAYSAPTAHAASATASQSPASAVVVIDASGSMAGSRMHDAGAAVGHFISSIPPSTPVGLVLFADEVRVAAPIGSAHDGIAAQMRGLEGRGGTALFDAVARAVAQCTRHLPCRVVAMSDGADTSSTATVQEVTAQASEAGVPIDIVALDPTAQQRRTLSRMSQATGGILTSATDSDELALAFAQAASRVPSTTARPTAASAASSVPAATPPPSSAVAVAAPEATTAPDATTSPGTASVVPGMAAIVAGLAALIVLLAGVSVLSAHRRALRLRRIRQVLRYQTGSQHTSARITRELEEGGGWVMRADAWLAGHARVAGMKARFASAEVSLTPVTWLLTLVASMAVLTAVFSLLFGSLPIGAALGCISGWLVPELWLRSRSSSRQRAFADELPDFLGLLASSLRAGLSFTHALDTAAADGKGEVERQMRRVLREVQVGASLDSALLECADRMANEDLRWTVTALAIQREVGGNLSTILDTASSTIKARHAIRREVRTLSAEGRLSAYVLLGLPLGVLGFLLIFRRPYIEVMWSDPLGIAMLIGLAGALITGWFWMRALVRVRV